LAPFTQVHCPFGGPVDTTRFTDDPGSTSVPDAGLSLITPPEATELLVPAVTVPTFSPTPVIAVVAVACVSPTTFGTDVAFGAYAAGGAAQKTNMAARKIDTVERFIWELL